MEKRASRPARLVIALAVFGLLAGAFAAAAHDPEEIHRHRDVTEFVLGAPGDHDTLFELLGSGGFLGVELTPITPELRLHFGAPEDAGVLVSRVVADSPAGRAGVRVGDVLTRVNNEDVDSPRAVKKRIHGLEDGDTAQLEVWRDGGVETLTALIEEREGRGIFPHRTVFECEDGEDCGFGDLFGGLGLERIRHFAPRFECGGDEDCSFTVKCEDGDCECLVNGAEADCDDLDLPRLHKREN